MGKNLCKFQLTWSSNHLLDLSLEDFPVTVTSSDDFGLDNLFVELQRMVDATLQMLLVVMLTFLQLHTWLMRHHSLSWYFNHHSRQGILRDFSTHTSSQVICSRRFLVPWFVRCDLHACLHWIYTLKNLTYTLWIKAGS